MSPWVMGVADLSGKDNSSLRENVIYINSIASYQKNEAKQRLCPADFVPDNITQDTPTETTIANFITQIYLLITVGENDLTVQVFYVKMTLLIYSSTIHFYDLHVHGKG